jgi:hypothetical protein
MFAELFLSQLRCQMTREQRTTETSRQLTNTIEAAFARITETSKIARFSHGLRYHAQRPFTV